MELCADNALHFQNCIPILCHLRKIVIHSFLPSKNVLRANVPSHFRFKWRQPFYTKIAICGHPPRGHDINLSRPPTNPYHLPEIAIFLRNWLLHFASVGVGFRWGLLGMKYAHAWQMKLLFTFKIFLDLNSVILGLKNASFSMLVYWTETFFVE